MVIVASLKIGSEDAFRVKGLITRQDFERNIKILHLIVAEGNVHIDGFILSAFKQQFFVNFSCFLVMSTQIVDSCEGELILSALI